MGENILAMVFIVSMVGLLTGCMGIEESETSSTPTPVASYVQNYTCWDGSIVQDLSRCPPVPECPPNCDDGNPCTADYCNSSTSYLCAHIPISGEQPGCEGESQRCKKFSCMNGSCVTIDIVPCCGNGICEEGEGCESCSDDCICVGMELCCNDNCIQPLCDSSVDCDDGDPCTVDVCLGSGTCNATCENREKGCLHFDGCCPSGCDFLTDNDCPVYTQSDVVNTSLGLQVRILDFKKRNCLDNSRGEKYDYLVLTLHLNNSGDAITISNSDFIIIDSQAGKNYTASTPTGTDCYIRDEEYILGPSDIIGRDAEWVKIVYFNVTDEGMPPGGKKILMELGDHGMVERYIWLMAPS